MVALTAPIAVVVLLIRLGVYSWRTKSGLVKWSGVGIVALVIIPVSSVSALTIVGMVKQQARRAPVPDVRVEATPQQITRGKALADSFCGACHSKTGTTCATGTQTIASLIPIVGRCLRALRRTKLCASCGCSFFRANVKDGSCAQRVAAIRLGSNRSVAPIDDLRGA
jgi:hypothetical protein